MKWIIITLTIKEFADHEVKYFSSFLPFRFVSFLLVKINRSNIDLVTMVLFRRSV